MAIDFYWLFILVNYKIDHHEKYTLSDCSDSGNRVGFVISLYTVQVA